MFSALLQHFTAKVISQGSLQGKWHLSKSTASLRTHKVLLFPVIDLKKSLMLGQSHRSAQKDKDR